MERLLGVRAGPTGIGLAGRVEVSTGTGGSGAPVEEYPEVGWGRPR
jgi:hypothetical protein